MRILFVVQHFRQGWGGAPESIRLMARLIEPAGYTSDVFDVGRFHPAIETLDLLPEPGAVAQDFDDATIAGYDAIVIAGPWQKAAAVARILKHRRAGQPLIYLPRGGLGEIEFARRRDLKKWPYLYAIERRWIDRSSAVLFSSRCEQDHTVRAARRRTHEVVVPDFFSAPPPLPDGPSVSADRPITFSFLAEIAPRKGLLPLVEAYVAFCRARNRGDRVRLVVAGSVRKGSEAYYAQVLAAAQPYRDIAPIEFSGALRHADRPAFYASTDIFVVPSLFESYCLTVLEGLAAGCATVAAPKLGALEFLPPHDRMSVATSADSEALAAALAIQFDRLDRSPDARRTTADYASTAIGEINRRALDGWRALLR